MRIGNRGKGNGLGKMVMNL